MVSSRRTALILVGAAGAVAIGIGVAAAYAKSPGGGGPPPPPNLFRLQLAPSNPSVSAGGNLVFTLTAMDMNGGPVSGVSASLFEDSNPTGSFPATGGSGIVTLQVQFLTVGTFTLYARAGSIQSGTVTISVVPPPPPPPLSASQTLRQIIPEPNGTFVAVVGVSAVGGYPPYSFTISGNGIQQTNNSGIFTQTFPYNPTGAQWYVTVTDTKGNHITISVRV